MTIVVSPNTSFAACQEKRAWARALTGRRAPWAFSDYLASDDRRAAARKLAQEAAARREAANP